VAENCPPFAESTVHRELSAAGDDKLHAHGIQPGYGIHFDPFRASFHRVERAEN
jgi:hypothetical protein